jgi:hypothetical protein
MTITRVYRDRDNNIKVKKFSFEEVKKDLTKLLSHVNRINRESQSAQLTLSHNNRKNKNETKRLIKHSTDS